MLKPTLTGTLRVWCIPYIPESLDMITLWPITCRIVWNRCSNRNSEHKARRRWSNMCILSNKNRKRKNMYILRKNTAFLLSATSIGSTIKLSFACNKRASPTTTQKESPQPKEIRNHPTWSLSVTDDKRQYYSREFYTSELLGEAAISCVLT